MSSRPIRLDLADLSKVKTPCILHWQLDHFVVLIAVSSQTCTIMDPACGFRNIDASEISDNFTGVALEVWPNPSFVRGDNRVSLKLGDLVGRVRGLIAALVRVVTIAIAIELLAILAPLYMQWVIDHVIVSQDRDLLTTLALGFGAALLIQAVLGTVRSWALMRVGVTLSVRWRGSVFAHLLRLPIQYFEKRHVGDIVSRFGSVDRIQSALNTSFVEAVLDGVMTCVTLAVMLVYSSTLALIAVMAVVLYSIVRAAWYRALLGANSSQIVFNARQQTHFLESVRGIRSLKLFSRENERRAAWLAIVVDEVNAGLRSQRLTILFNLVHSLLGGAENILIIFLGARMVMDGHFTVGALIAFNAYRVHFDERVNGLIDKLFQLRLLRLQGDRLSDIVLATPEVLPDAHSGVAEDSLSASVRIQNLKFRYSEDEQYILDDVSLSIQPREIVAISGPSGCGKSTLLNVILGIRSASSGEVLIGGVRVSSTTIPALRKMIGTVMQEETLFAGSIASNICFSDSQADRRWIEECARLACIHREISQMPMGYHTLIGDMGNVLSGGQRQRLLLARALYKRPTMLLLDEATGQLDVEREREVMLALRQLGVTIIVVAHRPETVALADRCVTLNGGRIVSDRALERHQVA